MIPTQTDVSILSGYPLPAEKQLCTIQLCIMEEMNTKRILPGCELKIDLSYSKSNVLHFSINT